MDGMLVYEKSAPLIEPGSWNAVSVTNAGAGLWDCVFAYVSRTATLNRFRAEAGVALGDVGFASAKATVIGVDTVTIRVATYSTAGAAADKSFNVSFQELG